MNPESRLEKLEAKLSFAEDLIETLNQTVFRQQEQIDLLQRQLTVLQFQMQEGSITEPREPNEEIPPHY